MDELHIPDDLDSLTPRTMIDDLENLAVKKETDGLTDAERTYQASLRQRIRDRLNATEH